MTAAEQATARALRAAWANHARLIGAILGMLGLVALGWFAHSPKAPSVPTAEAHTLDSLGFTAPIFAQQVHATARRETVYVQIAQRDMHRARPALDSSAFYKHLADSLTTEASNHIDTSAVTWEGIAVVRSAEAETARHAVAALVSAHVNDSLAVLAADSVSRAALARLAATTTLNAKLAADLAASDPPCRWALGLLHCQSRKMAFTEGALVAAGAVVAIHEVTKKADQVKQVASLDRRASFRVGLTLSF